MSKSSHRNEPALPGENPTVESLNASLLGNVYALNRGRPNYMPSGSERELINWIDNYISTANANRTTFPNVFSGTFPFSGHALVVMRERLGEALTAIDVLPRGCHHDMAYASRKGFLRHFTPNFRQVFDLIPAENLEQNGIKKPKRMTYAIS